MPRVLTCASVCIGSEGGGKRVYSRVVVRKENMEHLDALSRYTDTCPVQNT